MKSIWMIILNEHPKASRAVRWVRDEVRGVRDGNKLDQIGPKWDKCGTFYDPFQDMGQLWDFLRSVSVHFGAGRQNVLKLILKSPTFVPFGTNLT